MRWVARLVGTSFVASSFLGLACNGETSGPPPALPAAPSSAPDAPPVTTIAIDAGAPPVGLLAPDAAALSAAASPPDAGPPAPIAAGGGGAFAACTSDADCIAVPKGGCCNNGYKEAVNKAQASAYAASVTCAKPRICPQYIVNDRREARCSPSAHKCVMVAAGADPK